MAEQFTADVLICGAGAAGLTLAIELARRGVSFRLIEKMTSPFGGSRGKGIQPRTQEVFEDLGILGKIVAAGGSYPLMRKYHTDGSYTESGVTEQEDATSAEPYHLPLMVPQFKTEQMLRERLTELGYLPEYGCELIDFEQDAGGVTARFVAKMGEETLRVRWLVGADGGRSTVRHALKIDFPGKTLGVRAIVADVMLSGLSRDVWHCFNMQDMARQIMLCPLAGTSMFQIQAPVSLDGEIDLSGQGLTSLVAERTGRDDIHIQFVSWASAYKMNARLAEHYRVDGVFLIGDAAHIHPPTGGQGLNTSVQDAYNLGWKLAAVRHGAPDTLLDSYEEERRPVAAEMLGLTTQRLAEQQRGEMRRGRKEHQLDIGYPLSPLTLTNPVRTGVLQAGDRAPDAPIHCIAGQPTRLFELFKGTHWTLIGYQIKPGQITPRPGLHIHIVGQQGDLIDTWGHFFDAYAPVAGDVVLIRPDGYIGAFIAGDDTERLEEYLLRTGLGQAEFCSA